MFMVDLLFSDFFRPTDAPNIRRSTVTEFGFTGLTGR